MKKAYGFVLLALLVASALLTGCSSESSDVAEDYIEAVLVGEASDAQEQACASFQDRTAELASYFDSLAVDDLDLKFDIGKGNRSEEVIVTGSLTYGPEDNRREFKLQEKDDTRIVLWLSDDDGDWCVTDESEFGETVALRMSGEPAAEQPEAEATETAE